MPKKAHGRPARQKNRPRRPAAPRSSGVAATPVLDSVDTAPVATSSAVPARPPATAPRSAAAARRVAAAARVAGIQINYHYLRRDITTLAVLAPSMVVLLVLAFIFLH